MISSKHRGRGLPAGDAVARGVGLVSMRERAELMGGTFVFAPRRLAASSSMSRCRSA